MTLTHKGSCTHLHPAGAVMPLSSAACNVTPIIGDRLHKCAGGFVYSLVKMATFDVWRLCIP